MGEHEQHGQAAWVCALLGEIAQAPSSPSAEGADHYYRRALALAEPREMRLVAAHCHAGLAKLYRRTGKRLESDEHFTMATTMYREMDMRFWLEQTEKEMGNLR